MPLSQWLQHDDEVTRHHNVYATFSASTRTNSITLRRMRALAALLLDENRKS
ncbi:hypothetical protein KCP71_01740 [Salmonella enterica subsp. enterica]|nr:hypothetical protein KCP71_01740 [Salmonella enterica subsp. enterica]